MDTTQGTRSGRLLGGLVALVLVMAGCGSDDADRDEAAPPDSVSADDQPAATGEVTVSGGCGLIEIDEVTTITGSEVITTTELPSGCQWTVTADGAWYDWQSFPAEVYQQNRDLAAEGGFAVESATGLGDEAFLRLQVGTEGTVLNGETWVLSGDQAFQVRTASIAWSDDVEAAQRTLAELIAERL